MSVTEKVFRYEYYKKVATIFVATFSALGFENLPAHSRDFSRELAGRILSEKISRNADFFCSFCCAYGIIKMVINI